MKIVTAAQMQSLDRRTIEEAGVPGTTLMERAGTGVVACLEQQLGSLRGKTVAILCGKGNNGGDGFVVGRLLHKQRAKVRILALAPLTELSRDAAAMYRQLVRAAGKTAIKPFASANQARSILHDSDVIVDALLGTGLSSEVTGRYGDAIDSINQARRLTVAVDLPSGIHADTGVVLGRAVKADLTVTFGLPKLGLFQNHGIDHAGRVEIVDIGIPPAYVDAIDSRISVITAPFVRSVLPSRRLSNHKGTFGHAGIIAGSVGKTGAAAMCAKAALRVGAGLVTVAIPTSMNAVLEAKLLEAMTMPMPDTKAHTFARAACDRLKAFITARTAVAIGPGLSTHPETVELTQALIKQLDRPAVLDADALNALAGRATLLTECTIPPILTPHPGEMARLETDATVQSVNADRIGTATRFARERGVYLVLKGARTVIARPDGLVAICPTGNPGMATAGTGDVLTGMMAGLLAQGLTSWDAACAATYLHGLAGDLAAEVNGQAGMIAGDVIEQIPHALNTLGST
ncbi:NAD(P)H-hydrate dehydratase [Nitrospira sp. NS4]|uniref:NAD(P)H-hydrate dehydratase n=1 Tax=Nitrospira sp. NS4 TaxID=3414498 RepID=UPI003C2E7A8F